MAKWGQARPQPKLTPHELKNAIKRRDAGEPINGGRAQLIVRCHG
jgi:hypothetical protein